MPEQLNGRIDFWNIGYPLGALVYVTALISVLAIAWGLYNRSKYWRLGSPNPDAGSFGYRLKFFGRWLFVDAFGHKRLVKNEPLAGVMHVLIFWGMFVLFIATVVSAIEFNFDKYLDHTFFTVRWSLQLELIWDIGGIALLAGLAIAVYRRYILRVAKLDTVLENGVLLALIALMALSGFLLQSLRQAATELEPASFFYNPSLAYWSPASYGIAKIIRSFGLSINSVEISHFVLWWVHAALMSLTFVYAAWRFGPLMHIFTAPIAIFWRSKLYRPKGALRPMGDLMELEAFGASDITHLTTKQLIDLDACTNCGRCQDQCPAWASGKALSPRKLIQDSKQFMMQRAPELLSGEPNGKALSFTLQEAVGVDALWACTTCRACMEVCPVGIEHIDSIIDMRRFITMEEAGTPEPAMAAMTSMEQRGHPWRGTQSSRIDWAIGTDAITMAEDPDHEVLLWVGCTPALDPRAQKVARAMASVLKVAGVKYRILGNEETCTGDPARRLGNEYLFQTLAQTNIDTFERYGIQNIVTMCPHCFNSILNEYPQLGGYYQVEHYTQFVGRLVRDGKIKPVHALNVSVAYHDSCYLARHNDVIDEPREIAKSIPGLKLIEMEGNSKEKGFCCGAGGGQMFMHEQGERVNNLRTQQFLKTGASTVGVSCPFCLQMMEEGISTNQKQDDHAAEDIVELLAESVLGPQN